MSPVFSLELHRLTRESLLQRFRLASDGQEQAVLLFSGGQDAFRHDTDHEPIFRQESTFHYFFGVCEPEYLAAIDVDSGSTTLFAPRLPAEYALWMGEVKSLETIRELYGVHDVMYTDEIASWFENLDPKHVYVQKGLNSDGGRYVQPATFEGLRERFNVDEELLHGLIYECRVHKNEEEVRLMRRVNRASADAHIEVMRTARPGVMEFQLESTFRHSCLFNGGCRLLSYTPIVGSGPNSAILHYGHAGAPNNRKLEDGDMVLCDMGSELYCYASDITNSFPANGAFTPDQRLIFETVAAMQQAVLQAMRPGVEWAGMQQLAYEVLCERLQAGGLLSDDAVAASVGAVLMPHGLGHLLGVDTHDVGGYPDGTSRDQRDGFKALRMQRTLEPGMVLTVEPGVYFMSYALDKARRDPELSRFFIWDRVDPFASFGGVRLEDNVLVTATGIDNLTVAPRTVEEVEAVMRGEIADVDALVSWRRERGTEA